jgi:peptide-methionine (S)-S-oxide reductase
MSEVAVFGGGCFWCTEAVYKMLKGIRSVTPGYAGGSAEHPTYWQVASGRTGHAEVIRVEFDPAQITYRDLLTIFFGSHDATQINRQGADVGTEYRSIILYTTDAQRDSAHAFIAELNASSTEGAPIATEVAPLTAFYPAEPEHLDYYARNKGNPYCEIVIAPKLQEVQRHYAALLATHGSSA